MNKKIRGFYNNKKLNQTRSRAVGKVAGFIYIYIRRE